MKRIFKLLLGLSLLFVIGLGSKVYAEENLSVDVTSVEISKYYYKMGNILSIEVDVYNDGNVAFDLTKERLVLNIKNPLGSYISGSFREVFPLILNPGETETFTFYTSPQTIPSLWLEGTYRIHTSVYSTRDPLGYLIGGQTSDTTFVVDNTAPLITWEKPIDGNKYDGAIDLKVLCNEECDYINFWWRAESQAFDSSSLRYHYVRDNGTEFEWTLDTLNAQLWNDGTYVMEDGTYYLYAAGKDLAGNWARTKEIMIIVENRKAEIVKPEEDEIVFKNLSLEAYLYDNDEDYIQWAVRQGTCKQGTNTVLGNVDGHNDQLTSDYMELPGNDKYTYTFSYDVSDFEGGMYCFIFNPSEDPGETGIRLIRQFYIAEDVIRGGGQIIEEFDDKKPKDYYKISFGGQIWDLGNGDFEGDWEINFHNVGDTELNKTKFHGNEITKLNYFNPYGSNPLTCTAALNFTMEGRLGQEDGYTLIFRAGDYDSPGQFDFEKDAFDTVRITLTGPDGFVYDTTETLGGFTNESTCVGTARTGLDHGNITISY